MSDETKKEGLFEGLFENLKVLQQKLIDEAYSVGYKKGASNAISLIKKGWQCPKCNKVYRTLQA